MGLERRAGRYKVVINHEEQYSIVAADEPPPKGLRDGGKVGTKEACLDYIEEVWTDMKPTDRQRILKNF